MNFTKIFIKFNLVMMVSYSVWAEENMVAKVVILRGQVKAKIKDAKEIDIKADQDLPEGAVIQTAEKSFVKLIFIDKSQMNLGPSSQMVINAFPKKEAGIITLVKGQLRSQVTKNYMEMEDKNKSKLYIKTSTAAMGIRGTDFQVNFNPDNKNTALITFEGAVAMSHIEKNSQNEKFDQNKLEKVVSSDKAVMVTGGHISAVNLNVGERAMIPTKLAPAQMNALKDNETGLKESSNNSSNKTFRNPIPPGTEGAAFTNSSNELDKAIQKMGGDTNKIIKEIKSTEVIASKGDPNGFFNNKTGEYKMPAGSIIDLNTVNIIPPPANAVLDPNTKTFIVPNSFGKIDSATGEYKAPEGLKLGNDGKFKIIDADAYMKSQIKAPEEKKEEKKEDKKADAPKDAAKDAPKDAAKDDQKMANNDNPNDPNRAPASISTSVALPPPPPGINEIRPDMQTFAQVNAPTQPVDRAPVPNDQLKALAQDKITSTEIVKQNTTNTNPTSTTTNTHFIFNAP